MSFFRRNGNGDGNGEAIQGPVHVLKPTLALPPAEEDRQEYRDEAGMVWRCGRCGSMGTSKDSLDRHVWRGRRECNREHITEYVPRKVYQEEYEAKASQIAISGVWIVVKMPADTAEGSVAAKYTSIVRNARTGLEAIQGWYSAQIAKLDRDSTEADREEANGRYVAIDFFTGTRSEARVTSDWRANVELAEGSHA